MTKNIDIKVIDTIKVEDLQYISFDPNILGGAAVVKGTRIPVSRIIYLLKDGYTPEFIKENKFPNLSLATISGTISEVMKIVDSPSYGKASPLQTTS